MEIASLASERLTIMPELNAAGLALIVLTTLLAVWRVRRKTITPREIARASVLAGG